MAKTPRREWSSMSWLSCTCQKGSSESRSAPIRRPTRSTYWLCKLSCEHERRHGRKASRRCCSRCPYVGFNRQSRRWRLWSDNSAGYEDTVDNHVEHEFGSQYAVKNCENVLYAVIQLSLYESETHIMWRWLRISGTAVSKPRLVSLKVPMPRSIHMISALNKNTDTFEPSLIIIPVRRQTTKPTLAATGGWFPCAVQRLHFICWGKAIIYFHHTLYCAPLWRRQL